MSEKLMIDCESGEETSVPLTPEEQAERAAAADQTAQQEAALAAREQRRQAAIAKLTQIAEADGLTNQQAVAAVQFTARVLAKALPFLNLDPGDVA